jgi:hypothetical protein
MSIQRLAVELGLFGLWPIKTIVPSYNVDLRKAQATAATLLTTPIINRRIRFFLIDCTDRDTPIGPSIVQVHNYLVAKSDEWSNDVVVQVGNALRIANQ